MMFIHMYHILLQVQICFVVQCYLPDYSDIFCLQVVQENHSLDNNTFGSHNDSPTLSTGFEQKS